jgi:integrase/recombinase XerD
MAGCVVTTLRQRAEQYLTLRRALGYKLIDTEKLLMQFISHLEDTGASTVSTDVAVAWARQPTRARPNWWRRRLIVVRTFARHLQTLDPATEVPAAGLLRCFPNRTPPHLYSQQDIDALTRAAASRFQQPLRVATYQMLIGLLTVTGLRIGEAVRLDHEDVDLDGGVLTIVDSKFGKSRQVLLHSTTIAALRDYADLRNAALGTHGAPAFFVSTRGRLLVNTLDYVFADLVRAAGISTAPGVRQPRWHDFRHTFAVSTLLEWYRAGVDVQSRVPLLSTWLGHVEPASTYWYLQASPELLALAAGRLEQSSDGER